MKRYNNYHKHDHISSIITPDSNTKPIEYIERCKEIGEINYWTTNHGTGGDVFEAVKLCQANGINCKFGLEGYIVPDPLEKDSRNYHIIVLPKTNVARKKLNLASSKAHMEGYYYKPRLFLSDLLNNFDRDELFITTACMGGIIRDKDAIEYIFKPLYDKFKKNLLLEVQNHKHIAQIKINKRVQELAKMYNLDIVYANDSHYIYPHQSVERQIMLKGKGLNYGEEDDFILDYPDYEEAFKRCKEQGVLSDLEIDLALYNTLRFDECENIVLDKSIKMPTIYPDKTESEKIEILKGLLNKNFKDLRKHNELDESKIKQYKNEIHKEMKVIEDTSEVHSADYFLMNDKILNLAINKYGGTLTRSGRGSAGSELINRILGITQIDRLQYKLPLYSERFMSTARLLENKSMPDIDFNVTDQEPFVKASKELLGEHSVYPMVAYGTMQESEAFRNYCRSLNLPYDEYNEVAKNLDKYRQDEKWEKHIEKCQQYVGTIISKSIHPCSYCLYDGDLREEIGVIKAGDNYCVMITSEESDDWKYLKDDFLVVSVWDIIKQTFEEIGSHIITVPELLRRIDDEVWDTIGDGITATLNQLDGDYTTSLVKRYKPRNVEELAMFVACIRPSFASFREKFINRESYTTGSDKLDEVLANTNHYILFQENLMQFFQWLGVTPSESIGLIKKISKKKIKPDDFDHLTKKLLENWIEKTGSEEGFDIIWADMQAAMGYGFNTPHGLSYAIDCLYCAYLKTKFPLEYYMVVLNLYAKDEERTKKLIKELAYFDIKISSIKFRFSQADYSFNKDTHTIYKGINSVKYLNKRISKELYNLRNNKYDTFVDLLIDINEKTSVNSAQLDILIKLDFFSEFGDIHFLEEVNNIYNTYADRKQIAIQEDLEYEDIIERCSEKKTEKQYRGIDGLKLVKDIIEHKQERHLIPKTTIIDKIKYENEKLGYVSMTIPDLEETIALVMEVNGKFATKLVKLYRLKTGEIEFVKVKGKIFDSNPLYEGDIIKTILSAEEKKWKRNSDGTFYQIDERETILKKWNKVEIEN